MTCKVCNGTGILPSREEDSIYRTSAVEGAHRAYLQAAADAAAIDS